MPSSPTSSSTTSREIVDDAMSVIEGAAALVAGLVEICYFQKGRKELAQTRIANRQHTRRSSGAELWGTHAG